MQNLRFDPKGLLWRSRGRHWDYEFVSVPLHPRLPAWWSIFEKVFKGVEAGAEPVLKYGTLDLDEGSVPFVAAALTDAELRDWTGRPVQHFLAWFLPGFRDARKIAESLPADWPQQILAFFRAQFLKVFKLPEETIRDWHSTKQQSFGEYLVEEVCGGIQGQAMDLNRNWPRSQDWSELGSIAVKKNFQAPERVAPQWSRLVLRVAVLALAILVVWLILRH